MYGQVIQFNNPCTTDSETSAISVPASSDLQSYEGLLHVTDDELRRVETLTKKSVLQRNIRPITTRDDLNHILDMLVQEERYREALLIVMGVNFGLRYSDFSHLRYCDLVNADWSPKNETIIQEQKTGKLRRLIINDTVHRYMRLYLEHYRGARVNKKKRVMNVEENQKPPIGDFIFKNLSNTHAKSDAEDEPLSHKSMERMIKKIMKDAEMPGNYNTHSLRKTFGRLYIEDRNGDPTALYELQKIYGHSSPSITLLYIGLMPEELSRAYNRDYGKETLDKFSSTGVREGCLDTAFA